MLFMHSQPLPSSKSKIPTLGVKLSKMWSFHPLVKTIIWVQNWILLVKTSLRVCSVSKIKPRKQINWNHTQNGGIRVYLKKCICFICTLFDNFETAVGFEALKQVRKCSQFLILSPSYSYMQNEANFNWQFDLEKFYFWNIPELRKIIY